MRSHHNPSLNSLALGGNPLQETHETREGELSLSWKARLRGHTHPRRRNTDTEWRQWRSEPQPSSSSSSWARSTWQWQGQDQLSKSLFVFLQLCSAGFQRSKHTLPYAHRAPQHIWLVTSSVPAATLALQSNFSLFAQVLSYCAEGGRLGDCGSAVSGKASQLAVYTTA